MNAQDLEDFLDRKPCVLIFLPSTNELQRFVLSGSFQEIAQVYDLHFVVSGSDREKMLAAAPNMLRPENTHTLEIAPERFAKWSELFGLACEKLRDRSPSFAIRANVDTLDIKSPAFYARMPALLRKVSYRVAMRLSRTTMIPVKLRRKFVTLANLLEAARGGMTKEGLAAAKLYRQDASRIIDGMEPHPDIVALLDRFRPLFTVMPTSLLDLFCNDVLWASESEQVACLLLQSGWDNMSSKGIIHHMPTCVAAWGPQSKEHAQEIQAIPSHKIVCLGAPHYEQLQPANAKAIAHMRRELGVTADERLVLFGGSFRQFDETSALVRLESAIESGALPPMKVIYRPHPWRADRQGEDDFFDHTWQHVIFDPDMRDRYQRARAERGYLKRNVPIFDMTYLARLLSTVDAVISPMSTLLIEALIMDRPTMAVAFSDGKHAHNPSVTAQMTHFSELKRSPALVWCDDGDQFESSISNLLAPKFAARTADNRGRLLAHIVRRKPASYGKRLSEFCQVHFEPSARKLRAVRASRQRGHISHTYGANLIARDYCGLDIPNPTIPGYWMHGWIPAYHNVHTALIALHKKEGQGAGYDFEGQIEHEKQHIEQWVSREDQAEFLRADGYRHVNAIGLPILYIPPANVRRVPNSLLVMPPHSHKSHGPDDPLAEEYAEMVADISKHFEHVWVCLHEDDIAKNQWISSFRKRGIRVFPSADQADPYTLCRLHTILSMFECVTTNGYGSHIAYAAYCGAKTSIWGPFADFPRERITRTHAIKMYPELGDISYELCTGAALKAQYPFLFTEPHKAELHQNWGSEQLGGPSKLDPQDLACCFQWGPTAAKDIVLAS